MKTIKTLLVAVLALFATAASAQNSSEVTYKYLPHWYFQANAGAQYTLGEAKFSKLLSPNAQLGIGYNFNSVLGLRLTANAWQSKGGWTNPSQDYKWTYVAPQLDLTLNLTNAFAGFNPKRIVDVVLFLGGAANIAWGNEEASKLDTHGYELEYLWDGTKIRPFGRAGLGIDFNVSDRVKIGLEAAANIGSDKYNSKKAGNPDWYFNGLVGVKVALGKTYETIEPYVEPAPIVKPEPKPEPKPIVKPEPKPAPEKTINVFFKIRESIINEVEGQKVADMIAFLKANPGTKVNVTGYADAGTGNPRINMKYAKNRADAVTKALIDGGIAADRITTDAKGDTVQPFAENDMNRVTIAIAK
ncbi:MAG: OmpA family protein [Bacteroidaceae bacterium]|nr:OmpA family protein [Bacteroidaceae bacterium]